MENGWMPDECGIQCRGRIVVRVRRFHSVAHLWRRCYLVSGGGEHPADRGERTDGAGDGTPCTGRGQHEGTHCYQGKYSIPSTCNQYQHQTDSKIIALLSVDHTTALVCDMKSSLQRDKWERKSNGIYLHGTGPGLRIEQGTMGSNIWCRNVHNVARRGQGSGPIVSYCVASSPGPVRCE